MFGFGKGVAKGAAEGLVGPVAGAVSTVLTEKERTARARVEAELLREKAQLDAQSKAIERAAKANGLKGLWRPYLMFGLGIVCLLHSLQTAVMVWHGFFSENTITEEQLDLLIRWITYVMFVFGVLGAFGGVTAWRRSTEKLNGVDQSPVDQKRTVLQRMRRQPPSSPVVREDMDDELPPITKRMDGIVVPPRDSFDDTQPVPATLLPIGGGTVVPGADPEAPPAKNGRFAWGPRSRRRLSVAHDDIRRLFTWTLKRSPYDLTIGETTRTYEKQEDYVAAGTSKTMNSRHLERPAMAVDFFILHPETGQPELHDTAMYLEVLHILKRGSELLDIPVTSGGLDWGWDFFHVELARHAYPKQPMVGPA